jgi:hypothetical protein
MENVYMDYLMSQGNSDDVENQMDKLKSTASGDNNYSKIVDAILEKNYEKVYGLYWAQHLNYAPDITPVDTYITPE